MNNLWEKKILKGRRNFTMDDATHKEKLLPTIYRLSYLIKIVKTKYSIKGKKYQIFVCYFKIRFSRSSSIFIVIRSG